ncbi:hypothetical protein I6I97_06900 [Sphingobacterium multivorum]|uniref:hypothetical protein n=1 Tax=Sphingobacterium multivorum TaxID=28454 RepID=UPI00191A0B73|nr:hypothetical protein [Sphingobacterium multivorum]QQT63509.1 hypothetical protein I6I97_06900 [Sphingobacterium multivorum]
MNNSLIFQTSPEVTLSTNKFINVPVILKYEDTNLIEVVKEEGIGFTTQIPIYHQDGTYLAKVKGNRMYLTKDGEKAGLKIEKHQNLWVCTMDKNTLFEIQQQSVNAFKTTAEIYTPDGCFVKCSDSPSPNLYDSTGNELKIGGIIMSGNTISNFNIGIWLEKNGSCSIGVNG